MRYIVSKIRETVQIWDSNILRITEMSRRDFHFGLKDGEIYGNVTLHENMVEKSDLTNEQIYGKIYDNIITCGDVEISLIYDAFAIVKKGSSVYVAPCIYNMDTAIIPVLTDDNTLIIKKDARFNLMFAKVSFSVSQLKRFCVLGDWSKVFKEYRDAVSANQEIIQFEVGDI